MKQNEHNWKALTQAVDRIATHLEFQGPVETLPTAVAHAISHHLNSGALTNATQLLEIGAVLAPGAPFRDLPRRVDTLVVTERHQSAVLQELKEVVGLNSADHYSHLPEVLKTKLDQPLATPTALEALCSADNMDELCRSLGIVDPLTDHFHAIINLFESLNMVNDLNAAKIQKLEAALEDTDAGDEYRCWNAVNDPTKCRFIHVHCHRIVRR